MIRLHLISRTLKRLSTRTALVLLVGFAEVGLPSSQAQTADPSSQAALDSITSDLQQEISAGSTNAGATSFPIYVPTSNANMLPYLVGSTGTGGLENLLKTSIPSPFFSGNGYSTTGIVRASSASTTESAQTGQFLTAAFWNKALFLPVAAGGDDTPQLSSGTFTPPNWILVARDGSNPLSWNSNLVTSPANSTSVVGRYAYAIYHEGGLLDANVAGYPSTTSVNQSAYKTSLAYADLTQIGLTQAQIDMLVAWRNPASALLTGTITNPAFTLASGVNYYQYVASNSTGFLTPSAVVFNNQTDRMFTDRQALINFMRSGVGLSGAGLNALNYLGTFTRDLSQPSYVKTQSVNSSLLGYDSTAPKIQPIASGGNNEVTLDAFVNPSFLGVRVQAAFVRNDGSAAVVGEPLVKRRFALSRLAWLTYQGPSALRAQTDSDIQSLIGNGVTWTFLQQGTAANIQKYFGLTWVADAGSSLGKWQYNVHNGASGIGPTGAIIRLGAPGDTTSISALGASAHEPDFFELLKASVNAGSKAKAASVSGSTSNPSDVQARRDIAFDYAIIQLGANIIAQAKVDGYGVRIGFDNGTTAKEFYGVENNPYLYRVRWGVLKIRNEKPAITGTISPVVNAPAGTVAGGSNYGASQGYLIDPGVSMLMQIPEIWNPHDQNTPLPAVRPTAFRMVADSTDPDSINTTDFVLYNQLTASGMDTRAAGTLSYRSASSPGGTVPPFSRAAGGTGTEITGSYAGYPHVLQPSSTAMRFDVPDATLFREPTLLARYNVPAGSNLKIDSSGWNAAAYPETADYLNIETSSGKAFTANQGFKADAINPLVLPTTSSVSGSTQYVGIPMGLFPSEWVGPRVAGQTPVSIRNIYRSYLCSPLWVGFGFGITYQLQYQDPTNANNWITYDKKYVNPNTAWLHNILGSPCSGGMMQAIDTWASFTDPRTSRFGGTTPVATTSNTGSLNAAGSAQKTNSGINYATSETLPANAAEWLNENNNVLISNRPTYNAGYFTNSALSSTLGWSGSNMIQGLLSQNSLSYGNDGLKYSGAFGADPYPGTTGSPFYYSDADAVVRRGSAGYVSGNSTVGLPLAATYTSGGAVEGQSKSRPWILHRPFRSVAELGYVFSDTPWKNIDFSLPESGDVGLLDVFCVNDTDDPKAMVAGKVNLNTKQAPVLKAILSNAYSDEQAPGAGTIDGSIGGAAESIVNALIQRTKAATSGEGPVINMSELVGKWISGSPSAAPIDGSATYDGFSRDLSGLLATTHGTNSLMTNVPRFREAIVRPLASSGQTRVWNLMVDVVAQTGQYPSTATTLDNFAVSTQRRYWMHLAIDRSTGQILDQKLETVGPSGLSLSRNWVVDAQAVGATVATLGSSESLGGGSFTYSLVSGSGSDDNGSFSISGNVLQTGAVFDYATRSSFKILLCATDQDGLTFTQPVVIAVLQAGPYTQWKQANFGDAANDPAVAGDLVEAQHDGVPNLLKYALGLSPKIPASTGVTVQSDGTTMTLNYTKASSATDISMHAYWSNDLQSTADWSMNGVIETKLYDDGTIQRWQATVPVNSEGKMFMRLIVNRS